MESKWGFIIDTDRYAGNFERQLCAFCTGCVGECEVGEEYADMYKKEENVEDGFGNVSSEPDDHGCHRPVALWRANDNTGKYHSLIIYFVDKPEKVEIEIIKRRAKKFPGDRYTEKPKILGYRIVEIKTVEKYYKA